MRNFLIVVMIFALCVVGAGALSWPIYTVLSLPEWIPFDKFAKWLSVLTVAAATVAAFRYRRLRFSKIDFLPARGTALLPLGFGFIAGFLLLALLSATLYLLEVRVADTDKAFAEILGKLFLSILPTALLVSLIEETYFRGIQCGELMREKRTLAAITLPAIFYSGVHFLNPAEPVPAANPDWFHGLTLLVDAPAEICRASDCAGTAATLLIAGLLLGIVRALGGHLIVCIGIHAGWICAIKLTKALTDFNPGADLAWLAQGQGRFLGVLSAVLLAIPCLAAGAALLRGRLRETGRS